MATFKDVLKLVDEVSKPLEKMGKSAEKTNSKMERLKKGINTVAKVGTRLTAVVGAISSSIGLVGGKILAGAKQFSDMGDRIDKMSQKIGMSTKAFQEWDYIMSQNGGNVDSLQMGFKTLVTQIEGVQKGSKDSIKAFKSLGVNVKNAKGQFKSADEVFNESIRALQKINNPTQKMILANRLFGRSAAELRPLINQEAAAVDELREKANKLGLILTDEEIKNAVKYKDTMDTFTRFFQAKFANIIMNLMPEFNKTLEELMTIAGENQEVFENLGITMKWIVTTALPAIVKGFVWLTNSLKDYSAGLGKDIGTILSFPMELSRLWGEFKTNAIVTFMNIYRWVEKIVNRVSEFVTLIKGISGINFGKTLAGAISNKMNQNSVRQSSVSNTTNNQTTNNNYFGNTYNNLPFTPLTSSAYTL